MLFGETLYLLSHLPLSERRADTVWETTKPEHFLFPFFTKEFTFTPHHFSLTSEIFRSNSVRILNNVSCGLNHRVVRIQLDISEEHIHVLLRNAEADDKLSEIDGLPQCRGHFNIKPFFRPKFGARTTYFSFKFWDWNCLSFCILRFSNAS
jgi:hypothetical protein